MYIGMKFKEELMRRLRMVKESREINSLAERSGIDQGNLSRIARGQQNPGLDKVSNLLDAMGATVMFPGDIVNSAPDKTLQTENADLKQQLLELQAKYITLLEKNNGDGRAISPPSSKGRAVDREAKARASANDETVSK